MKNQNQTTKVKSFFILGVNGSPNKNGRVFKMLQKTISEIKKEE